MSGLCLGITEVILDCILAAANFGGLHASWPIVQWPTLKQRSDDWVRSLPFCTGQCSIAAVVSSGRAAWSSEGDTIPPRPCPFAGCDRHDVREGVLMTFPGGVVSGHRNLYRGVWGCPTYDGGSTAVLKLHEIVRWTMQSTGGKS
ncbi:hypothetical protein HD554DRAFT_974399 [Boletus coccyginus]|nr:hypothetical protein HD554DRAFT_974399 [Boletus coccyginus]